MKKLLALALISAFVLISLQATNNLAYGKTAKSATRVIQGDAASQDQTAPAAEPTLGTDSVSSVNSICKKLKSDFTTGVSNLLSKIDQEPPQDEQTDLKYQQAKTQLATAKGDVLDALNGLCP